MLTFATIAAALLLAALIAYLVLRPRVVDRRFGLRMVGDRHGYIEMRDDDRIAHVSYEIRDDARACAVYFFDSEWILPTRAPLLPAGTILHLVGWYDNSPCNHRNIEPRNWKGYGQRSIDDMFQTSSMFVYFTDEEFKAEVAARVAKRRSTSGTTAHRQ